MLRIVYSILSNIHSSLNLFNPIIVRQTLIYDPIVVLYPESHKIKLFANYHKLLPEISSRDKIRIKKSIEEKFFKVKIQIKV